MNKNWTIETLNEDGTWSKLATLKDRAWRFASEANAARDIVSKHGRRYLDGCKARPVLIDGAEVE